MFAIERVVLNNFRSYHGLHVFEIPAAPGLYNLTGKNILNLRLQASAVGKSSLLDAIYWCLYGKTTRGLKAMDVVTWGEKTCEVSVTVTVGDQRAIITRVHSPNSLKWCPKEGEPEPIDQDRLDKFLRLSPESFLYSVMLPQFAEAFADLSPSAKLSLFSSIMELDYWLDRSAAADGKAKALDLARNNSAWELSRVEGQQETIKGDLEDLHKKESSFSDVQTRKLNSMESDLKGYLSKTKELDKDTNYCRNVLVDIEEKIVKLTGKMFCPSCKQLIPSQDLKDLYKNKSDFEDRLKMAKWGLKSVKDDIAKTQERIKSETNLENPYSSMIAEKKQKCAKLKTQAEDLKGKIAKIEENHAAVSFWVSGFKRIRLFIVEETLRQLEIEVNNNLASLGLIDWRIEFDVERENKSGGITKGFVIMISPPGAKTPIRYESYSGGETQRLRLACDLGLANLIMERNGLSNTIEFYDEPSGHMNPAGLTDLAEALALRAQNQGKRIFLVDHHIVDFSGFAGTFTVTKDQRGSRLG